MSDKYNFDKIINRKGTNALKLDALEARFGSSDLIPLWVADMDFLSPSAITDAIIHRVQHGIFGYTMPSSDYYNSIIKWIGSEHDWHIEKNWLTFIPGIVKGIAFVIDCFTQTDQEVLIQPPVYHPFRIIPSLHQRIIVNNPLKLENDHYELDIEGLKNIVNNNHCKLLILCNPHNPGGKVWSRDDLKMIADICYDNDILVISDEIHSDLVFEPNKHTPFASVSEKAAQNSITFMAPSKTFNIAGIVSSYSIIPNEEIRNKFNTYLTKSELDQGHIFAYVATQAAYDYGKEWLSEVKLYIWNNINFVDTYLKNNIPQIKAMIPEASFLVWLDCRALGLSQNDLVSLFIHDAGLALNDGTMFGQEGVGFMRLNVGCPKSVLEKALCNLKNAIKMKSM